MKILHFLTSLLWHFTCFYLVLFFLAWSPAEASQSNPGSNLGLSKVDGKERNPLPRAGNFRTGSNGFSAGNSKSRTKSNTAQTGAVLAKTDDSKKALSRAGGTDKKTGIASNRQQSGIRTVAPKVQNVGSKAPLKKPGIGNSDASPHKVKNTKEPVSQRESKEAFRHPAITPHEYMLSLYRTLSDAKRKGVNGSVKLESGLANTITSFIDKGQGKKT